MSEEDKGYKYLIPLDKTASADVPLYSPGSSAEVVNTYYGAQYFELVQDQATPHFHKDSVDVEVEEVDLNDYR